MGQENSYEWVPLVSFGPFLFGSSIKEYGDVLCLWDEASPKDGSGLVAYRVPDKAISVNAVQEIVIYARSWSKVYYKNTNLVGMTIPELERVLGVCGEEDEDKIEYDDGSVHTDFEFDSLNMVASVSANKVVSVGFGGSDPEFW